MENFARIVLWETYLGQWCYVPYCCMFQVWFSCFLWALWFSCFLWALIGTCTSFFLVLTTLCLTLPQVPWRQGLYLFVSIAQCLGTEFAWKCLLSECIQEWMVICLFLVYHRISCGKFKVYYLGRTWPGGLILNKSCVRDSSSWKEMWNTFSASRKTKWIQMKLSEYLHVQLHGPGYYGYSEFVEITEVWSSQICQTVL